MVHLHNIKSKNMQWWNIKHIYLVFPFYATIFYSEAKLQFFHYLKRKCISKFSDSKFESSEKLKDFLWKTCWVNSPPPPSPLKKNGLAAICIITRLKTVCFSALIKSFLITDSWFSQDSKVTNTRWSHRIWYILWSRTLQTWYGREMKKGLQTCLYRSRKLHKPLLKPVMFYNPFTKSASLGGGTRWLQPIDHFI